MPHRSKPHSPSASLFGRRLREARSRADYSQEELGVMIGLDEGSARARISRYETGANMAPETMAKRLAYTLGIPLPYFYCEDEGLARLILAFGTLDEERRSRALELVEGLAREMRE